VIVSDDLEMKAIADHYPLEEAVIRGALAGVDLFLICEHASAQHRAIEALVRAVESGTVPRRRIDESVRRLDALTARFARPAHDGLASLGSAEHLRMSEGLGGGAAGPDPTARRS
jgi:beta-N-acetylhexosaminidase